MQLDITGHHVELTDGLKEKVQETVKKLERHFDHITYMHVTLTVENRSHIAEAKIDLDHHTSPIFAKSSNHDMYESIDDLVAKLDRQLIKHKEKIQHKGNDGDIL